jgi:chromate transport protein ChrA
MGVSRNRSREGWVLIAVGMWVAFIGYSALFNDFSIVVLGLVVVIVGFVLIRLPHGPTERDDERLP